MKNRNAVTRLVDVEIEAKIGAAIAADLKETGKQPSDMGRRDAFRITDAVKDSMSPEAKKKLIHDGVSHLVKMCLGEMIADRVWDDGCGWDVAESRLREIGKELKFGDLDEAVECYGIFRDEVLDFDRERIEEYSRTLDRFKPLFVAQPADATLGEIATRKAMFGDKLALSFLAWKEVA